MKLAQLQMQKEEIIKKYEAGKVVHALAAEYKCGHVLIRKLLTLEGIHIRNSKEARIKCMEVNPEAGINYIPTPEEIAEQKILLRKKHRAKKQLEPRKQYPTLGIGRTGTETVSTRNVGKK